MKQTHLCRMMLWIFLSAYPFWSSTYGQESADAYSRFSVSAAIGSQVTGFPFQNQFTDAHFALTDVGLGCWLNKHQKHSFLLTANGSVIQNATTGNSLLLGLGLAYQYSHPSNFLARVGLEMGGGTLSHPRETYVYAAESRGFEQVNNPYSSSYSSISFGIGYNFEAIVDQPISLFLTNKSLFQTPYFDLNVFPVLPQNILALGLMYRFKK